MTFKNQRTAYCHLRSLTTHAKAPRDLRGYWTKVDEFFCGRREIIVDVNATIGVAIIPAVVECQRTEWRRVVSIFANTRQKSVTIATSLQQAAAISYLLWSQVNPVYFLTVWRRSVQALWWKHQKHAYFGHVCTHSPMQIGKKFSRVTASKFTKFCHM